MSSERGKSTLVHELLHAASATTEGLGKTNRAIVREVDKKTGKKHLPDYKTLKTGLVELEYTKGSGYAWSGVGINEGVTEYFTRKICNQNEYDIADSYNDLTSMAKDFVKLYGVNTVLDAYVNETKELEQQMAKDGKSYTVFRNMIDAYYRQVYNNKDLGLSDARRTPEAKEKYNNICQFISEIYNKRGIFNDKKLECVKEYKAIYGENFKSNLSWFQKIKNTIKYKFNMSKNEINMSLLPETANKRKEFLDGIKVDTNREINKGNKQLDKQQTKDYDEKER